MVHVFRDAFPNEAVVAVYDDSWRQFENIHKDPINGFELSQEDSAYLLNNPPILFLHSHPKGNQSPSDRDSLQQLATGWNWGIVAIDGNERGDVYAVHYPECWGDGLDIPPLVGRTYLWGVRDCWNLVRDYYRLNGFPKLKATPRARDPSIYPIGTPGNNMFAYWPPKLGFKQIEPHARKPGDMFIMHFRSDIPNHCGIWLSDGKVLHQMEGQLSTEWSLPTTAEHFIERHNVTFWRLRK